MNAEQSKSIDEHPTSSSLLERLRTSDELAWRQLSFLYTPLIRFWGRRSGLQDADVEDLVQEVLRSVNRAIHSFERSHNGSFRSWLRTITYNKLRDFYRLSQRSEQGCGGSDAAQFLEQLSADGTDSGAGTAPEEKSLVVRQVMDLLASEFEEKTWQAFWKVVAEGRDIGDVATELGMSRNAVYIAKSRLLGRLRAQFADVLELDFT